MTLARRLSAATLALVLALFPVALERCRAACVTAGQPTPQVASAAHACHDAASSDDNGSRMDPLARACGHSDDAQAYDSGKLVVGKSRTAVLSPAVAQFGQYLQVAPPSLPATWPLSRVSLSRAPLPLNPPLRL
jgi:hypothetical protein